MKVLIADPDWRFAQQATAFLESRAHDVVVQPAPAEAAAQARRWRPDVVIVAAQLAEAGLLEAVHTMDSRPAVLLTSWLDSSAQAWRAWQRGGDELLIKPVLASGDLQQALVTARERAAAEEPARVAALPA